MTDTQRENSMQDVRWKQRFQNFDRALRLLSEALLGRGLDELSALEQEGAIQRFEYTYELAWKTMKDYLEESGVTITPVTPRQVLKEAFAAKLTADGQVWIDMMLHRNVLSHTYDFEKFTAILLVVQARYVRALTDLRDWLAERMHE